MSDVIECFLWDFIPVFLVFIITMSRIVIIKRVF